MSGPIEIFRLIAYSTVFHVERRSPSGLRRASKYFRAAIACSGATCSARGSAFAHNSGLRDISPPSPFRYALRPWQRYTTSGSSASIKSLDTPLKRFLGPVPRATVAGQGHDSAVPQVAPLHRTAIVELLVAPISLATKVSRAGTRSPTGP